jgi:diguanylate cyclase (GGDEF)-like protein
MDSMEIHKKNQAKILIVDDKKANLIAFTQVLDELPATIIQANSGAQALQLITEHKFALVLLDVQMPGMDGFETAELMKKNSRTDDVPIIFITAISNDKQHVFKGYKTGAVDYLCKPIDNFILQSKARVFLDIYYQKTLRLIQLQNELKSVHLDLKNNNNKLQKIATLDSLTNINNREQFEQELSQRIKTSHHQNSKAAILIFDIDDFKNINESFGHEVGDQVLRLASIKILSVLRTEFFFSRLSGDEFAIIIPSINKYDQAGEIAEIISNVFNKALIVSDHNIFLSLSTGIACYPVAGKTKAQLMKSAEIAMHRAKKKGKNTYEYYTEALNEGYQYRSMINKQVVTAITNNELRMEYQFVYELETMRAVGVEALARWNNAKIGNVSPIDFIPALEKIGLTKEISQWILNAACSQFSLWQGLNNNLNFAINLSLQQLKCADIANDLKQQLIQHRISPDRLTLELTEDAVMKNCNSAQESLNKFNKMGVTICINNFGSGHSSLIRLRKSPIHSLKIDKSLVSGLASDLNKKTIVKTILSLARSLGITAIALGIETKEQFDFLIEQGCIYGQGIYLSEPSSADEITSIIKELK